MVASKMAVSNLKSNLHIDIYAKNQKVWAKHKKTFPVQKWHNKTFLECKIRKMI